MQFAYSIITIITITELELLFITSQHLGYHNIKLTIVDRISQPLFIMKTVNTFANRTIPARLDLLQGYRNINSTVKERSTRRKSIADGVIKAFSDWHVERKAVAVHQSTRR